MDILDKHPIQEFPHRMLYKYVYFALKQNVDYYCNLYNLNMEQELLLKEKLDTYKVQLNNHVQRKQDLSKQYQQEMVNVTNYFKKLKTSHEEKHTDVSMLLQQQEATQNGQTQ